MNRRSDRPSPPAAVPALPPRGGSRTLARLEADALAAAGLPPPVESEDVAEPAPLADDAPPAAEETCR